MYKMSFELLKEDKTLKEKIIDICIIVWYSLGLIAGLFLITVDLISLQIFGVSIVCLYLFIEFIMYYFNCKEN